MIVQVINESLNMLPAYETPQSAGMDVRCTEHIVMNPGRTRFSKNWFICRNTCRLRNSS
jgi:dUTPase